MARKILLADDSVTAQNMGRKILADAGYEVITVNNGSAALKKIGEQRPDLIVLDVYMPGYGGLEVCQRLKDVGDTARIPILLTVGKLEPFKPEEAKRVRADAFIVKPFEASELLSALSKLEDKVVPRAESSKPGRFARATAAIEEAKYDKTMAVEEGDSGWKNRISFPKKKKEKPVEQEIETGEIYNQVNKDLRTVVEHKPEHPPDARAEAVHTEAPVNLGALAPAGLPKDVTAEEIAALAAAAAQIKGKVIEEKPAPLAELPVTPPVVEPASPENVEPAKPENVEPAKIESKEEAQPVAPAPVADVAVSEPPATLAAQEAPEKAEEKKPEHKSGPAEVMAAIAGLETEWISLPAAGLGNGSWPNRNDNGKESTEPVTMAVAAPTQSITTASRWTAVAVALAPEETGISLEQEMQKAHAAFAAAEGVQAAPAPLIAEPAPAVAELAVAPATVAELPTSDAVATQAASIIPDIPAPEITEPPPALSEASSDAITAEVKELEAVAAKYEVERRAAEPAIDSLEAVALAPPAPSVSEAPVVSEPAAASEEKIQPKIEEKIEEKTEAKVEEQLVKAPEPLAEEIAAPLTTVSAVPQIEPQAAAPGVEESKEEPETAPVAEPEEPVSKAEVSEERSSSEESMEPVQVPVPTASTRGGTDEMAKRESETAAAWASWRKIRGTGTTKPSQPAETSLKESQESAPPDKAAMAVAAGAESKPEEVSVSLDSDPEIASIVDSVLDDMRPKIVEEIARKLGKKK